MGALQIIFTNLLTQIVEIVTLGIIGGAVPGPILTAVFADIVSGGLKKGLRTVLSALMAESIVAVLILTVLFALHLPPAFFNLMSIGGVVMLLWLAWQVWQIKRVDGDDKTIFSFSKIFALTVLSGPFWLFWITVCVPRAHDLGKLVSGGQFFFLLLFETGWLIMTALLAFIFSHFRSLLLKKQAVSSVFRVFALVLVFFAIKSLVGIAVYYLK